MKKKCIKKLKKFPSKKTIKNLNTSRKISKIKNTLTNYFSFSNEKKDTNKKLSM